jgi:hypothetical protein
MITTGVRRRARSRMSISRGPGSWIDLSTHGCRDRVRGDHNRAPRVAVALGGAMGQMSARRTPKSRAQSRARCPGSSLIGSDRGGY